MFNKLSELFRLRLNLPPKTSPSLDDDIQSTKQALAITAAGSVSVYASWSDEIEERPFDIPKYTAFHGVPTIVIYVSSRYIPDTNNLANVFGRKFTWAWRGSAFLDGPYPVLRCTLSLPDNPSDPLFLESPLNIREGEVQAFCEGALRNEQIDILVAHESIGSDKLFGASYGCSGIAKVLLREVNRASAKLRPTGTEEDFRKSVRMMETKFPRASAGLEGVPSVPLVYAGEVRNRFIKAE
jgi:hypothetical protein